MRQGDKAIRYRFRSLYVKAAFLKARGERMIAIFAVSFALAMIGAVIAASTILGTTGANRVVFGSIAVATAYCLLQFLVVTHKVSGKGRSFIPTFATVAGAAALANFLISADAASALRHGVIPHASSYRETATLGAAFGVLVFVVFTLWLFTFFLFDSMVRLPYELRTYPEAIIFIAFVRVIERSATNTMVSEPLGSRREVTLEIERAARAVEYGLRQVLRLPNARHDAVLEEDLHAMATTIRSFQLGLVMPQPSTLSDIAKKSAIIVRCVCSGMLGSLPTMPLAVDPPRRIGKVFLAVCKSVAIGLFPISLVALLVKANVLDLDSFGRTVLAASIIWAAVSVLIAADPLFASKLTATRDFISAIRGEGNTK
jgi:hypothetical protein